MDILSHTMDTRRQEWNTRDRNEWRWIEIDSDGYILSHAIDERRQQWNTIERDEYRWIEMESDR